MSQFDHDAVKGMDDEEVDDVAAQDAEQQDAAQVAESAEDLSSAEEE